MKKMIFAIFAISVAIFCLSSCSWVGRYEREIEATGKDERYAEGYEDGYRDGVQEGVEKANFYVEEDLHSLSYDIEDKWGIYPEEAIQTLENYADGEPVTNESLETAIWAACEYYHDSRRIIYGMESYLDY